MVEFLSKYKWHIIIAIVILIIIWLIYKYGTTAGKLAQAQEHPSVTVLNPYNLTPYTRK